jgi:hypothetical protein
MLADMFLGKDPTDIDLVHERIKIIAIGGNRNWWIEPAFWDIDAENRVRALRQNRQRVGNKTAVVSRISTSAKTRILVIEYALKRDPVLVFDLSLSEYAKINAASR